MSLSRQREVNEDRPKAIAGVDHEVEGAGFGKVADKKLTEFRFVLDLAVFNHHRRVVGMDPLGSHQSLLAESPAMGDHEGRCLGRICRRKVSSRGGNHVRSTTADCYGRAQVPDA